jgi:hypothetical protein
LTQLEEDAATFLELSDELVGLPKRDLQKRIFRLKRELSARYEFTVEGFEDDYEARLLADYDGDEARFTVDRRGDETEINAFVVAGGDPVVNEVREF